MVGRKVQGTDSDGLMSCRSSLNVSNQGVEVDVHPGRPPHVQYISPPLGPIPVEVEVEEARWPEVLTLVLEGVGLYSPILFPWPVSFALCECPPIGRQDGPCLPATKSVNAEQRKSR